MTDAPTLLLVNGPNLNLLGIREPDIYGHETLADVEHMVADAAKARGFNVKAMQSNHEGVIIDAIHEARTECAGIIINPGGLSHTSISLRDALSGVSLPVAEVHVSDILKRESFRHFSYVTDVAQVHVIGQGVHGYVTAVNGIADLIAARAEATSSKPQ